MAGSGSLPYLFLLSAIALGLGMFFWGIGDFIVAEIIATEVWSDGSEETMAGRDRMLSMWDTLPIMIVTGISFSLLWASRRGRV